jgi:phage gp36-like protein
MPYVDIGGLIDRYGETELVQLTDTLGVGAYDEAVIARAIADADAVIDGYLAGRYRLPLEAVPSNLALLAGDIVRYRLWRDAASEEVRRRYDDAIGYLNRLADGRVRLAQDLADAPDPGGPAHVAGARVFDAGVLDGY